MQICFGAQRTHVTIMGIYSVHCLHCPECCRPVALLGMPPGADKVVLKCVDHFGYRRGAGCCIAVICSRSIVRARLTPPGLLFGLLPHSVATLFAVLLPPLPTGPAKSHHY